MNTGVTYINSISWELNQPISSESQPFISILPERLIGTTSPKDFSILPKELGSITEPNNFIEEDLEIVELDLIIRS